MSVIFENVSYGYGDDKIFDNISASFDAGELVCVLGPNGVGKSTLFKCMLDILKPTNGRVTIDGHPVGEMSVKQLAQHIAYIPQLHIPSFEYRVIDIVVMGKTPNFDHFYQTPTTEDEQEAFEYLQTLGIEHLAQKNYSKISGGERQLALIARALMQKAKIIIMDEPTASLDFGNQFKVYQQMKKLTDDGYIIFVSTHHPEHALSFATTILTLKPDLTYITGKPLDIITPALMKELYQLDVMIEKIEKGRDDYYVCVPL